MTEVLQVRIHGRDGGPTLIYLPGLHGDWTLIGGFRQAVRDHVRFVEITYPRTLAWSLDDYAAAIESALADSGIASGWILAESFGSQVAWALIDRGRFAAEALILAGGFAKYPIRAGVRFVEWAGGRISLSIIVAVLFGYAKIARWRFRNSPATAANIQEFINRRTELDRQAAIHRLRLIANNDPCRVARDIRIPVFALSGFVDPIVPWLLVRPWLRRNCPMLRDYRIIRGADHNVLGTGLPSSARQVLEWMKRSSLVAAPSSVSKP